MNLIELINKRDRRIQISVFDSNPAAWLPVPLTDVDLTNKSFLRIGPVLGKRPFGRDTVRGLVLEPGTRIQVVGAAQFWPHFALGAGQFEAQANGRGGGELLLQWLGRDGVVERSQSTRLGDSLIKIAPPVDTTAVGDLVIEALPSNTGQVFLGVHWVLNRGDLFDLCKGRGVEIGPGPKPQILPNWRVEVVYVEQATPEQWQTLYGKDSKTEVDPHLWKHYVVGNAHDIPVEAGSLDFIFSSHLVEHLANPIGHFEYWARLLKPQGLIVAVIPDKDGCKDYVFPASTVEELLGEWKHGSMMPTLAHYTRWAKHRAPKSDPAEILDSGRSIHVHFYTPSSMAQLLGRVATLLGFKKFTITSRPNHKDFFVVLNK